MKKDERDQNSTSHTKQMIMGRIASSIAHEIRSPLNTIRTSASFLLAAKDATPEKVTEHLKRIDRQVAVIDGIVTALSDVSKLPDNDPVPINPNAVIASAIEAVELPENISIKLDHPDEIPLVVVDENQLAIAIKNLIRNARDAMPDGGEISICILQTNNQVVVRVCDIGCGIQPEHLEKVFEPLFTTKAVGMGLGLTITRAIVEKNQGQLAVESELGKGSCFSIHLKRA